MSAPSRKSGQAVSERDGLLDLKRALEKALDGVRNGDPIKADDLLGIALDEVRSAIANGNPLLDAANDLVRQIESLAGESSVIDEDLETGEPLARLRAEIARAETGGAL